MATPIGTLGNIPTLNIGGRVFTDLDNLKTLIAQEGGSVTSQNCTFREVGTSVAYQVPGGKTFKLVALKIINNIDNAAGGASNFDLYYTDNDVGYGTNTALTNPVGVAGASVTSRFPVVALMGDSREIVINFSVPTGKYITMVGQFLVTQQINIIIAYGYEV